ncbi:uncharacterized protein LOC134271878 [Saccostrea cucullata]|uniref:uncharacterized protein LOC134271878 n=1 Tax=Saccostrea cuccullata TaxID=36930 RepID=UPI002ED3EB62
MSSGSRYEADIDALLQSRDSKNTQKVVKTALKLLQDYLIEKYELSLEDMEKLSIVEMSEKLKKFYAELRKPDGSYYAKKSLITMRFGLQKHFLKKTSVDIINSDEFKSCNEVFKAMLVKIKREGAPEVKHKQTISTEDLNKLYESEAFSLNTAMGLLNRTFFEIVYYFCNRGQENLRSFQKTDFSVRTDPEGKRYVCKVKHREEKNHRGDDLTDDQTNQARMYEMPGNPRCPVNSFMKYIVKLNPDNPNLWQRPKSSVSETQSVWFDNIPLGKNTLAAMMSTISKSAEISTIYTNHCIRATCITNLDRQGIEARHIVGISGHKNISSIMSYSTRLSDQKQFEISKILCESSKTSYGNSNAAACSDSGVQENQIDFLDDFDVDTFFAGLENFELHNVKSVQSAPSASSTKNTECGVNIHNSTVNINIYTNKL